MGKLRKHLIRSVREAIGAHLGTVDIRDAERQLEHYPNGLADQLSRAVINKSESTREQIETLKAQLARQGYTLLEDAFPVNDLPDTPQNFAPIPLSQSTLQARITALTLHSLLGLRCISYKSENSGNLFVNLVSMDGEGRIPEKSKKAMRGHTDAVSFPFPDESDPEFPTISPSPGYVTLIGLRNPDLTSTHVISLNAVLDKLHFDHHQALLSPGYTITCQNTFKEGTIAALGEPHIILQASVLKERDRNDFIVRFSHSKVAADEPQFLEAKEEFSRLCEQSQVPVTVSPGSILIINNRKALHGRKYVGGSAGGKSRWLIRTYAIEKDCEDSLSYCDDTYHVLFP